MAAQSAVKNEKVDSSGLVTRESRRRSWPEAGLHTWPAIPFGNAFGADAHQPSTIFNGPNWRVSIGCLPGASPGQGCTRPAMPVFGVSRVGSSSPTTAGGQPRQASTHRPWSHDAEKSGHPAPPEFYAGPRALVEDPS